jgi:hypothetical protein
MRRSTGGKFANQPGAPNARRNCVIDTRQLQLSSHAADTYSFRKTRTFVAKILMAFSDAYANIAAWIAPWAVDKNGADE